MNIDDVMRAKERPEVVTIRPEADVRELLVLLAEHNIGAVVVSTDAETLAGIVSERDVVRHLHDDGTVADTTVGAIMTVDVETCAPDTDLDAVMQTMTDRRVRHLPVLRDGVLVGVVSIGDVVKHKIGQLQFERDELDRYVHQS
ncbi:CBS domain-containing protein [Nocardioides sp. dk4132]|uniref:CBS domain-containing protein n=1 Tax=unclassified Nocardioides TaxID=2615069 RepID=UPI0012972E39|nr:MULTISPECIES: CBS domain-containing protein [unclassified Nocardioides]MQW75570.1 CBS domain-containing protein [Nocardioides sp. dk4132]QGA08478.1 CBS domain-containing protein [Nocardioides sp. dk884]